MQPYSPFRTKPQQERPEHASRESGAILLELEFQFLVVFCEEVFDLTATGTGDSLKGF